MVPADTVENPHQYLSTFRTHVLDPIETATTHVDRERREIERERDAFEEFATRVKALPTVSGTPSPSGGTPVLAERPSNKVELLQEAYEETVMDISHYDTVYGESIGDNVVAEYGPEFASLFDSSNRISYTEYHKETLVTATRVRVEERTQFGTVLERELESLRTAHRWFESTLEEFDSTIVPDWYHERFETQLEGVLEARQSDIGNLQSRPGFDGHGLCEYLYAREPWTYPVLTAGGRLLDSIVVRS